MITASRSRLIALAMILVGAGLVWFNASDDMRSGTRSVSLVALAAGGALLATKGRARRLVSFTLVLAGLILTLGGNTIAIVSGLFVTIGGVIAVVACPTWPVMGVRFERRVAPEDMDLWAALDRGEDPTSIPPR
ncbi:MAG TPA: Trp biosynthesis-associated membrane protein [Candidatus Limnocylindrales bacterium]